MADANLTTRRALLKAAPALALVGAGTAAASQADSPIMTLMRRYMELTQAADVHPSMDDDEMELLFYQERDRIEDEMMALPSVTAADFAAKAIVATCRGGLCLDWKKDPLWVEARALIGA